MDIKITVEHNIPEYEFRMMQELYPTGKYHVGPEDRSIEWFTVLIKVYGRGEIELTWFKDL